MAHPLQPATWARQQVTAAIEDDKKDFWRITQGRIANASLHGIRSAISPYFRMQNEKMLHIANGQTEDMDWPIEEVVDFCKEQGYTVQILQEREFEIRGSNSNIYYLKLGW